MVAMRPLRSAAMSACCSATIGPAVVNDLGSEVGGAGAGAGAGAGTSAAAAAGGDLGASAHTCAEHGIAVADRDLCVEGAHSIARQSLRAHDGYSAVPSALGETVELDGSVLARPQQRSVALGNGDFDDGAFQVEHLREGVARGEVLARGVFEIGSDDDASDRRTQLGAVNPGTNARNLRAKVLGLFTISSGLGSAAGQIVLHGQHRFLVFGLGCGKVRSPLPVIHRPEHIAGVHMLALMRVDGLHIAVDGSGNCDQVLRRNGSFAGYAHGQWTKDKEERNGRSDGCEGEPAAAARGEECNLPLHQRLENADKRDFAIEQSVADGYRRLAGEDLDHLGVRQIEEVWIAALVEQKANAALVVDKWE